MSTRPGEFELISRFFAPLTKAEPGALGSLDKHGNPNVLTRDVGTSKLAQGPSAQSALVEIERYDGTLPKITAFHPPPTSNGG